MTFQVLGPPSSAVAWLSYFNTIAYQTADDIFSLSELEHCVLRAGMSAPANFLSKMVLPKSRYAFALATNDARINFALNVGSECNPPCVVVYEPETLDAQLRWAATTFVRANVQACACKGACTIALPKVFQWFAKDFGKGSAAECAQAAASFLEGEQRAQLEACLDAVPSGGCTIRFLPFDFVCRPLALYDGSADDSAARERIGSVVATPRRQGSKTCLTAEVVGILP